MRKNSWLVMGMLTTLLACGLILAACGNPAGPGPGPGKEPEKVTLLSTGSDGTDYKLVITKDTNTYELTVTKDGVTKTSKGKATATGSGYSLLPTGASDAFAVTVSDGEMTAINGTITYIDGTSDDVTVTPTPKGYEITISGITETKIADKLAKLDLYDSMSEDALVATGQATISGNSLTVELENASGKRWTGTGSFYIAFSVYSGAVADDEDIITTYVYTNGAFNPSNVPKYTISSASTTIPFVKFEEFEDEGDSPFVVDGNKVTITGAGSISGKWVSIELLSGYGEGAQSVAGGLGFVSGTSLTVTLTTSTGGSPTGWKGSGEYVIYLRINSGTYPNLAEEGLYIYTNGQTFTGMDAPKYNFTSASTTIDFNLFRDFMNPGDPLDGNKVVLTGAGSISGMDKMVKLELIDGEYKTVALGGASFTGDSVTISLEAPLVIEGGGEPPDPYPEPEGWKDTGEFYITITVEDAPSWEGEPSSPVIYHYTGEGSTQIKYNFTEEETIISFSKFTQAS